MKILMLTRYYFPHVGGVERHINNVAIILKKKGHDICIISTKNKKNLKVKETIGGVDIVRIPTINLKIIGIIYIWLNLFKNIKIIKSADIVHAHDVFIWYLPFRLLFPRKKIFTTFHGYESYPISKRAIIIRKLSEYLSYGNICIGKFIEKWYGTKANIISYGGIDLDKFKSKNNKKYQYDAIFSSRLDEQTGILTYLDTINILRRKGINVKLLTLGGGKYLKEAFKNSVALGWIDNPEKYFSKARFAFVSRYLAILEAFSSKKLVFAVYDNPLKKDYLSMTPFSKWIVVADNSEKLANNIEKYLKNKKLEKVIVERAYKWVINQTWEKLTDQYLQLWNS